MGASRGVSSRRLDEGRADLINTGLQPGAPNFLLSVKPFKPVTGLKPGVYETKLFS